MAYRIIYTSAPRLLQAGRSGFGVVARHREVPQDVAEFAERISQFSRAAGFPADRVVCAYRVFKAPSGSWHILSRISDAGASFTARTNHLAEHLVIDEAEIQKVVSAGGTPAGVMLAYSWPSFAGDSRWLSPGEAWEASALRTSPYGDKWAELCPDSDPKRRRLLSCGPGVTTPIFFEYPDRLRTPAGAKEILQLFAESESDCPKRGWGCAFTTDLQPSDNQADFQWIGLPSSSPLAASLKASGRKLVDFRSPVPQSSAAKPSAAAGKISSAPSTGSKVKSPSQTPRKRAPRSSWPMWLKVLLGCLGVFVAVVVVALILLYAKSKPNVLAASSLADAIEAPRAQAAPSSETTDHTALAKTVPTPKPPPPPRQYEKTFLVRYVENQRPGMVGSDEKQNAGIIKAADTEAAEFFKNNSSSARVEYVAWQSDSDAPQVLCDETGPVLDHRDYGLILTKRGEAGRPPSEPLDLRFHSTASSQPRPLRIIELESQSDPPSARFPLPEAEFVIEAAEDEESVNVLDIKGNPDSAGLRSRSDEDLVLRPEKSLLARLLREVSAQSEARNLAIFTASKHAGSMPTITLSDLRWIRERRMALQDEAAGKFPPYKSNLEGVVGFLKGPQSRGSNLPEVMSDLLGYFGAEPIVDNNKPPEDKAEKNAAANGETNVQPKVSQQVDPAAVVLTAATKLSEASNPDAREAGKILSQIGTKFDASKPKQGILEEFEECLRQEKEEQLAKQKVLQQQARKTLDEVFGNGNSLLPAGDYILGLSHKGKDDKAPFFYPAMKVRISFDREVEEQKGYREGQKSLIRAEQTPQTQ